MSDFRECLEKAIEIEKKKKVVRSVFLKAGAIVQLCECGGAIDIYPPSSFATDASTLKQAENLTDTAANAK